MATNRYGEQHRSAKGRLKVMESINRKLYRVEIWALNDITNRNGWRYINLEQHLEQFRDIPILTAYLPNGKIGDGHNYDLRRDPRTGEEYASFTAPDAERIVGWVPKDANIRIEKADGVNWIVTEGYLWTWYARELVEKIARQGGGMEISIETLVTKEHREGNVDVEEEYIVLGITVLGDGVLPAVAGANIQTLTMLRSRMENEILKAAAYAKETDIKKNERVKIMGAFNKQQLAELGLRFDAHKVLAALETDAGIHVCLMAENGSAATYVMGSLEEAIVPAKIKKVNAQVAFSFGNDVEVKVDSCEMTDALAAKLTTASASAKDFEDKFKGAEETIKTMREAENKRRVAHAKSVADATLEAFNANCKSKGFVDAKVLETIKADIDKGAYTNCLNADGDWDGDARVETAVYAACAKELEAQGKAELEKNAKTFVFGKVLSTEGKDNSVDGLLRSYGIR